MKLAVFCFLLGSSLAQPQFNPNPLGLGTNNNGAGSPFQTPQLGLDPNFGAFRTFQLSNPVPGFGNPQAAGVSQSSQGPSAPPSISQIQPLHGLGQLPQLPQQNGAQSQPQTFSNVQSFPSFNQPLSPPSSMTSFSMPNLFNLGTPAPSPAISNFFQQPAQAQQYPQMFGLPQFPGLFHQPFPQMNLLPYQQQQQQGSASQPLGGSIYSSGQFGQTQPQQPQTVGFQQQTFNGVIPVDNTESVAPVATVAPAPLPAVVTASPKPLNPLPPAQVSYERIEHINRGSVAHYVSKDSSSPKSKEEVSAAEMPGEDVGKYMEENAEVTTPFMPVTVDVKTLTTTMKPKVLDFRSVNRALKEEAIQIAENIEAKQRERKFYKLQKYRKETDPDEIDVQNILSKVMDAVMPMQPREGS
ncbi:unnamed protein product [Auanema sp. JU1783]|nr:unnamed protein product [Auanema sp. JU1783]